MRVKHAVSVVAQEPAVTVRAAEAADESDFDILYVGDVQSTHRELWTTLALIGSCTDRVQIGPGVTNPVTRHPAVTSGALASIDEISCGRAFLGLGTGDSAVRNLNLKPATIGRTLDYALAVRAAHEDGRAEWDGVEFAARKWDRRIPIFLSAHGPKALQAAGLVADGVIAGIGTTPEAIEYVEENVALGAKRAGRDPADIQIWHMSYPSVADTRSNAVLRVAATLAAGGNLLARSPAVASVPHRLRSAFDQLAAEYTYTAHVDTGIESPNTILVEKLGLTDYLASRFALAGTPDEVRGQIVENSRHGVNAYWHIYSRPDLDLFVRQWGSEIIGCGTSPELPQSTGNDRAPGGGSK